MEVDNVKFNYLFEISWEVCNKVGGIYTVVTSKLNSIMKHYENYILIGPYTNESINNLEVEEVPYNFIDAKHELEKMGIKIHYGTWNIPQRPKVILVEYLNYSSNINNIKGKLWEKYSIDSLGSDWNDFDNPILWSWSCGIVIDKLMNEYEQNVYVHCHEWMSGGAIFYLDSTQENKFRTIFTTHATMIGRSIAGNNLDLYGKLKDFDTEEMVESLGVKTKHQTEKALAHTCNVFSTVSEITALETEKFYDKKPDIILYNGFDNSKIPEFELLNHKFTESRNRTNKFLQKYFEKYYNVDMDKTHLFYTSGRYEYRNKGLDIYIKSLKQLNQKLKEDKHHEQVINLFLIMIGQFEKIPENYNTETGNAPLCTHYIEENNEIMKAFREHGLENKEEDHVKVILIPIKISDKDDLFNRDYYEFVTGMDLGIFPSYYEPWGYTPLESISYGVPSITSDLSGFGASIENNCGKSCPSVKLLNRRNIGDDIATENLAEFLYHFAKKGKKELLYQRNVAKWLALKYDWNKSVENYLMAYEMSNHK